MTFSGLTRRWGGVAQLVDILEAQPGGIGLAARDFALVTLAGELAAAFPGQLVFKGGFVLRHGYGHLRFSTDVDATRHRPPRHRLDANDLADVISRASITNVLQFAPGTPTTDSARSLDFAAVRVSSAFFRPTSVQVEVSYREGVVDPPLPLMIGVPYFEPFEILTLQPTEMAAEKLRALAQRRRETDLADLAVILQSIPDSEDHLIERCATVKFEQVKQGRANRLGRIEATIDEFAATYDDVIPQLFPGAPDYRTAVAVVWQRAKPLIP